MSTQAELAVFRELAELYDRHGQPQLRDRFLLLAADAAQENGEPLEADQLCRQLLRSSPHHMLKPFGSFAEAMDSPDVRAYVGDLRESYPLEVAQQMLASLKQSVPPRDGARDRTAGPQAKEAEDVGTLKFPPGRKRGNTESRQESTESIPLQIPPAPARASNPAPLPTLTPGPAPSKPPRLSLPSPHRVVPMPRRESSFTATEMAEPPRSAVNSAVAMVLFVVTLLLGLALAGYTLLKPFWR